MPVARLLLRVQRLPLHERLLVWAVYREVRKGLQPADNSERLATALARQVLDGAPYTLVSLSLKLSQAYSLALLRQAGARVRVERALMQQSLHLIRMSFREKLGLRAGFEQHHWTCGRPAREIPWQAFSDGSVRPARTGAGATWASANGDVSGALSVQLPASSALLAELSAATLLLHTLHALGARAIHLHVDSRDTLCAFEQRLPFQFCLEEALLQRLVQRFEHVTVSLIPRAKNHEADRLAAGETVHRYV